MGPESPVSCKGSVRRTGVARRRDAEHGLRGTKLGTVCHATEPDCPPDKARFRAGTIDQQTRAVKKKSAVTLVALTVDGTSSTIRRLPADPTRTHNRRPRRMLRLPPKLAGTTRSSSTLGAREIPPRRERSSQRRGFASTGFPCSGSVAHRQPDLTNNPSRGVREHKHVSELQPSPSPPSAAASCLPHRHRNRAHAH